MLKAITNSENMSQPKAQSILLMDRLKRAVGSSPSMRLNISLELGCSTDEIFASPALQPEEDDSLFLLLEGGLFGSTIKGMAEDQEEGSSMRRFFPSLPRRSIRRDTSSSSAASRSESIAEQHATNDGVNPDTPK